MEGYRLIIKPSASKELQAITDKDTLLRLIERIKLLQVQPRPSGSEKLAGRLSLYRVRQGNYRVIYSVDDQSHVVDIIKVGHRRDVYR
ncbi:type II toxin-antitoxin system RelE/ParE family toxin [Synechococcus sp. Cruz CV12-2-Slac-r]|uniref:type II toxin-antitoxin system RelE/ParE family toxin n=1 Tax=Synechococcus sp. Cruz CV12-2-Slac-r TaxID=2823748 RepID=UPI0037DA1627|nr:type II toxin-antitoxin system RelE/ParE family toxin [Synechococcus sp. Cruz CV12-2-Slac-r]